MAPQPASAASSSSTGREVGVAARADRQHSPAGVGGLVAALAHLGQVDAARAAARCVRGRHGHSVPEPRHARADLRTCLAAVESATVVWTSNSPSERRACSPSPRTPLPSSTRSPPSPDSARRPGLRITSAPTPEPSFEVTAAAQGEPGDQVVEQGGATVYLDETAAELLDDKVLDAAVDPAGKVEFALALQG